MAEWLKAHAWKACWIRLRSACRISTFRGDQHTTILKACSQSFTAVISSMDDNPFRYWDSITSARAARLTEEEALEGATTISLETQEELIEDDIYVYVVNNFRDFLLKLRALKPEQQEMLLAYYVLGTKQESLAAFYHATQTQGSFRIRTAAKALGCFIMMGTPTVPKMAEILTAAKLEDGLNSAVKMDSVPLSVIIDSYARYRSFEKVANLHKLWRPDVRKIMSAASKQLLASEDIEQQALGTYIFCLIDKQNPIGVGKTRRQMMKQGDIVLRDPDIVGEFRMKIEDPGFNSMFVTRANR
jgi:DNA-directed RNA polymerase specialized sigma24 family protein